MENSPALGLVWKIGLLEAVHSKNDQIFPEHLYCALTKLTELGREPITKLVSAPNDVIENILAERELVRKIFSDLEIDTTESRHKLREKIPLGDMEQINKVITRSDESREIFSAAQKKAQERHEIILRCPDLLVAILENPTPAISEVIGSKDEKIQTIRTVRETPQFNEAGRNILEDFDRGKDAKSSQWEPQVKALLGQLKAKSFTPIILIGESQQDLLEIVQLASNAIISVGSGSVTLIDYQTIASSSTDPAEARQKFKEILGELSETTHRLIYLYHFDQGIKDDDALREIFITEIPKSKNRFITGFSKENFYQVNGKEKTLRVFREIWVYKIDEDDDIPLEL